MNRLNGLHCYLSGAIDFAEDMGRSWRDKMTEFLLPRNVKVLDPLKPIFYGAQELEKEKRPKMKKLLEQGQYHLLRDEMKVLNHWDLRAVDISSFVVVNYDTNIFTCGTHEEIFNANKQLKPVLLVCVRGKKKMPSWMYGRFPPEHMFETWSDLHSYLKNIDENPEYEFSDADKKRWLFFDLENQNIAKSKYQKPIVIIESPLSGDVNRNIIYAKRCMTNSLRKGEAPFVSHLLYTQVLDDKITNERDLGMDAGWSFIKKSDFTAVYDDYGISKGMESGIDIAKEFKHRIEYRKIGENP